MKIIILSMTIITKIISMTITASIRKHALCIVINAVIQLAEITLHKRTSYRRTVAELESE